MKLGLNIFMFFCMYMVLPILYFMLRNEAKPKKNIILGVTLPFAARQDAAVLKICKDFKKQLDILMIILTIICFGAFFIEYSSVIITYYMIWLIFAIIVPYIPYVVQNRKLKALKLENGWKSGAAGKVLVDIKIASMPKKQISVWWFLLPAIISFIPVVYTIINDIDTDTFWLKLLGYGINASLVTVFYCLYRIIYRQKAEVIDENTTLSMALTRVRQYNWSKCWIWLAWTTGIYTILFWLFNSYAVGVLAATAIYTIVLLVAVMNAEFTTRKVQQKLSEQSGTSIYVDEDDYWIGGLIYYNPHDNHIMINNRVGFGTSINMAKAAGKIIMGISALCILSMPLLGIWMIKEEFTPLKIEMDKRQVKVIHTSDVYTINIGDIQSAELIEKLPSRSKIVGSGSDKLLKGKFKVADIGTCELCLNPESPPFILIKTSEKTYIIGSGNSTETRRIFNDIKANQ